MKKLQLTIGSVFLIILLNLILVLTALSQEKIEITNVEYPKDRLRINFTYFGEIKEIEGFQIYLASGISNDFDDFKLIADIKISNDSLFSVPNKKIYTVVVQIELDPGAYTLFMQSYVGRAIRGKSNYFTFRLNKESNKTIKFISTPEKYAYVGEEYIYIAKAEGENTDIIIYELIHSDAKVDFDRKSGTLKWTPEDNGKYRFSIRAYVSNKPSNFAIQDFEIIVFYCKNTAKLTLNVNNNLNKPIETAFAQLFSVDNNIKNGRVFYDAIVEKGVAVFDKVDKGTYYLLVYSREFKPIYYKDATDIIDATPIKIDCNDELNLEMKINQFDNDNFYLIKGRVTREESGEAVNNAMIEFIRVDDNRKPLGKTYWAYTDPNGYYQIAIPGKMLTVMQKFICRAIEFMPINNKTPNIVNTIYYNQKKDILEADLLVLPGLDTIVNFQMPDPSDNRNSLSGKIIDENNQALKDIWIVAYRVEDWATNSRIKYGYTRYTDNEGKFEFTNLYPGEYILLAVDLNREYVPGYYKEGEFLVKSWEEATKIEVGEITNISNLILKMQKLQEIDGNSKYKGRISKKRNGIIKLDEKIQSVEPVSGALIYAIDKNNKVRKFEFSDNQGNFVLDKLTEGNWKVLFDKIGFAKVINDVELSSSEVKEENVVLEFKTTSVNFSEVPELIVYPQPAKDKVNLILSDFGNSIKIKIMNVLGKEVFNQQYQTNGNETITLELPQISAGVYMIYVEGNYKRFIPLLVN